MKTLCYRNYLVFLIHKNTYWKYTIMDLEDGFTLERGLRNPHFSSFSAWKDAKRVIDILEEANNDRRNQSRNQSARV